MCKYCFACGVAEEDTDEKQAFHEVKIRDIVYYLCEYHYDRYNLFWNFLIFIGLLGYMREQFAKKMILDFMRKNLYG
jgi:hypothetical protein